MYVLNLQVVAHEIAHNIGIRHDFNKDKTPRKGCNSGHGIMDYVAKRESWSDCSLRDFSRYLDVKRNKLCLDCKLHFTK